MILILLMHGANMKIRRPNDHFNKYFVCPCFIQTVFFLCYFRWCVVLFPSLTTCLLNQHFIKQELNNDNYLLFGGVVFVVVSSSVVSRIVRQ